MASKSKRNRVKFKWTKELIILMCSIVVLIVAAVLINIPTKAAVQLDKYNKDIQTYNTDNNTQFNTLPTKHVFKETTVKGIKKIKKSDDYSFVFYCALDDATTVEYLSKINEKAKDYKIKTVYLWFADYVQKADEETKATLTYRNKVNEYNDIVNDNINSLVENNKDLYFKQDNFDLEKFPALLVFKSDSLIFNSQTYSESDNASQSTWDSYVTQALGYAIMDKAE